MEVRPSSQFKRSRLTVLPPELVVRCLEFLPFGEVHTEAKQVSKGMRAAARRALRTNTTSIRTGTTSSTRGDRGNILGLNAIAAMAKETQVRTLTQQPFSGRGT